MDEKEHPKSEPIESSPLEQALMKADSPETELVVHEETPSSPPPSPPPKVSGVASLWMMLSTIVFTLGIYLPIYLFIGLFVLLIVVALNAALFFGSGDGLTMANMPVAFTMGIGGVLSLSMLVGLGRSLSFSEEEKLETSVRALIFTALSVVLLVLTGLFWFIDIESSVSATAAASVMVANASTLVLGYVWFGGTMTWSRLVNGLRDLYQHPFAAGVWSCFSTLANGAVALGVIILMQALPTALGMFEDKFPEYFDEYVSEAESTSSALSLSRPITSRKDFDDCFQKLMREPYGETSYKEQAVWRVRRKTGFNTPRSEDVVHKVLLNVCLSHQAKPTDHLPSYFNASINKGILTAQRRWSRECSLKRNIKWIDDGHSRRQSELTLEELQALFCQLGEQDRQILELSHLNNLDDRQIGRILDISEGAVRQRRSRAKSRLLSLYNGL